METIKEGAVNVTAPEQPAQPRKAEAFYNPRMRLNRDLSMLVANEFFRGRKSVKVCEPLAATGIRALRYAKELSNSEVWAGDKRMSAVSIIKQNVELSGASVNMFHGDANELMSSRKYDLIDIDPFGTPSPFLDAALSGLKVDGLLGVTATDMMALCGVQPKTGTEMPKYMGAIAIGKIEYVHEVAVRLLLGLITRKSERNIRPLLSLSQDHYIRVFVTFSGSKKSNIGYLNHCPKCLSRSLSSRKKTKCSCGAAYKHAGPLWTGKLWDKPFCQKLKTDDVALSKILGFIVGEASGKPLFYTTRELYKGKEIPKMEIILKEHNAARTHFKPDGVRFR